MELVLLSGEQNSGFGLSGARSSWDKKLKMYKWL